MRCAHCGADRREVSLWADIVALRKFSQGEVVCCFADELLRY